MYMSEFGLRVSSVRLYGNWKHAQRGSAYAKGAPKRVYGNWKHAQRGSAYAKGAPKRVCLR